LFKTGDRPAAFFHQCAPFQPGHTGPVDVTVAKGHVAGKNRSIEQEDFVLLTSQEKYRRRTGATSVYNDRFVHATSPQPGGKTWTKTFLSVIVSHIRKF
jgi:hypothetical protein